jgi:hypothetical protein
MRNEKVILFDFLIPHFLFLISDFHFSGGQISEYIFQVDCFAL